MQASLGCVHAGLCTRQTQHHPSRGRSMPLYAAVQDSAPDRHNTSAVILHAGEVSPCCSPTRLYTVTAILNVGEVLTLYAAMQDWSRGAMPAAAVERSAREWGADPSRTSTASANSAAHNTCGSRSNCWIQ